MKNREEISKYNVVNYKHGGAEMAMAVKNMERPTINVREVPKDIASRVDIFIC